MKEVLRKSGLKLTGSRLSIIDALESRHCPLSAEEIHKKCKGAKVDLVTVYRNLKIFEDKHLIRKSSFGDGVDRYELAIDDHHHHHLVCRDCHRVQKLPDCNLRSLEQFAKTKGFSEISHHLEIFGLCSKCA